MHGCVHTLKSFSLIRLKHSRILHTSDFPHIENSCEPNPSHMILFVIAFYTQYFWIINTNWMIKYARAIDYKTYGGRITSHKTNFTNAYLYSYGNNVVTLSVLQYNVDIMHNI